MIAGVARFSGFALVVMTAGAAVVPADVVAKAMQPDRVLECTMRRATNADTSKLQTYEELTFEGAHRLVLHLGPIEVRTGAPPDAATEEAESVSPLTRIDADPDGLLAGVPVQFSRVVDRWPERVEIATDVDIDLINFMALSPIDVERRTARLFMTFTNRQLGYNIKRIFLGDCSITVKP
jgi:hypothetical protein